jgi:hypothetical protein
MANQWGIVTKNKAPSRRTKGPCYEEIEGDQLLSMLISIATGLRKLSGTFECPKAQAASLHMAKPRNPFLTFHIRPFFTTIGPDQRFKRDVPAISSPRAQMPSPAP